MSTTVQDFNAVIQMINAAKTMGVTIQNTESAFEVTMDSTEQKIGFADIREVECFLYGISAERAAAMKAEQEKVEEPDKEPVETPAKKTTPKK